MAAQTDMRKWVIYAGLALVVTAALAVSLSTRPEPSANARKSQVISAFINLSAAPDPRGVDFLARARIQRENRATRLMHISDDVLTAYAIALSLDPDTLRLRIADPDQTTPFDHTGARFDRPDAFATGQTPVWSWALVTESALTERAETRASDASEPANCGQEIRCRAWMLYWTKTAWYYAPVGSAGLTAALQDAVPELAAEVSEAGGNE